MTVLPEPTLVVDLGSVAVSAALVVDDQVRLMKEPGGNALRWPSSLCADADGLSVGTAAERRKRAAPAGYVADIRTRAVDPSPLVAGNRSLTGPDIAAVVLAALRAEAERLQGTAPTRLTLTAPVNWSPGHPGRDALIAAGEAAGFQDVDAVLLVGGSSRMPVVAETLTDELGRPLRRPEDPDLAVVLGAAEWFRRRPPAVLLADAHPPGLHPLHWNVPGGVAQLHRWLVRPRDHYSAGAALARIRLPDGSLWDLTAAEEGAVERLLVEPSSEVRDGQWLAFAMAGR